MVEGEEVVLTLEDVEVDRIVKEGLLAANEGSLSVAISAELNEELLIEGIARELVNKINTMRREQKFDVSDRIKIEIETTPRVQACWKVWHDYIAQEVLAVEVKFQPTVGTEWDLNGERAVIAIKKS